MGGLDWEGGRRGSGGAKSRRRSPSFIGCCCCKLANKTWLVLSYPNLLFVYSWNAFAAIRLWPSCSPPTPPPPNILPPPLPPFSLRTLLSLSVAQPRRRVSVHAWPLAWAWHVSCSLFIGCVSYKNPSALRLQWKLHCKVVHLSLFGWRENTGSTRPQGTQEMLGDHPPPAVTHPAKNNLCWPLCCIFHQYGLNLWLVFETTQYHLGDKSPLVMVCRMDTKQWKRREQSVCLGSGLV